MKLNLINNIDSLPKPLLAFQPDVDELTKFVSGLKSYFEAIDTDASEENLKFHLMGLLKQLYTPQHSVEQHKSIGFVIRTGSKKSKPAVLFEFKRESNHSEMIRPNDLNRKAMHEAVLYFMQERTEGNTDIRKVVICTEFDLYVFDAMEFEKKFYKVQAFREDFNAWRRNRKVDNTTNFFYKEICAKFIESSAEEISAAHIDLKKCSNFLADECDHEEISLLYKQLSPFNLLKLDIRNDSNVLNKGFYEELLYIIGLEERKFKSKHKIVRLAKNERIPGTLLENTISSIRNKRAFNDEHIVEFYGARSEEREFNIALELCLTWINRILFLKLLEAQLLKYNNGSEKYLFLNLDKIVDFSDLSRLFFDVLAIEEKDRDTVAGKNFENVPYLNSALFEETILEQEFSITNLNNHLEIPIYKATVLEDKFSQFRIGSQKTLEYLFEFFDAYDFGATENGAVRKEGKTLINASVLGLIFEKINGYKDGAIFTPGYITMYMARTVIEKTVIEAFQKKFPKWQLNDLDDLKNNLTDRSKKVILDWNSVIDDLKICDPAVGSGHFLVSCLNE